MAVKVIRNEDVWKDKCLTFHLLGDDYVVEVSFFTETIGILKITAVSKTQRYVEAVIHLRGQVIPVVDV